MRSVVVLCLLSLLQFSCKKLLDPIVNPPVDPKPKEKLLVRVAATRPNSDEIILTQEWKYDNSNRCTEMFEKEFGLNGADTLVTYAHYRFYYNGTQKEPYRISQDQGDQVGGSKAEAYLTYTADGKKLKDSVLYTFSTNRTLLLGTYRYGNEIVYYHFQTTSLSETGSVYNVESNDTIYTADGNARDYRKTRFALDPDNKFVKYGTRFSYLYDNKINPFREQNIASALYQVGPDFNFNRWSVLYAENGNLSVIGYNTNNIIKIENETFPNSPELFNYSYDEDNYPKEALITSSYKNGVAKITFEYNE